MVLPKKVLEPVHSTSASSSPEATTDPASTCAVEQGEGLWG